MSLDEASIPVSHRGQIQALRNLLVAFETQTQITTVTQEELDTALEELSRYMGDFPNSG